MQSTQRNDFEGAFGKDNESLNSLNGLAAQASGRQRGAETEDSESQLTKLFIGSREEK